MNTFAKSFRLILSLVAIMATLQGFPSSVVEDPLAERLIRDGKYREASDNIEAQLREDGPKNNGDRQIYYYNRLSLSYLRMNSFDTAMLCARKAFALSAISQDSSLISDAWKMMSYSYNRLGYLDSAIFFTDKLLNYARRVGDDHQYSLALSSMATILMQNQRPAEALKNFMEANRINRMMNDTASFAVDYFNIGLTHLKMKQYDTCLNNLKEALAILENGTKPDLLLITYGTIADCYMAMGIKEERKKYLLLAMEVAEQLGSSQFMAMSYCNIIQGALEENDFTSALKYGFLADSLLKKEPFPVQQMRVDSMMYVAYKNLSNPGEALTWYERFVEIKSQVISENQTALLNRVMVEYEVKEKNLRIEKQEMELQGKTRKFQLLLLLFVITTLFAGSLMYQNRKLRKSRESLYRKEKYMEMQQKSNAKLQTELLANPESYIKAPQKLPPDTLPDEQTEVDPGMLDALYAKIIAIMEDKQLYLDSELGVKTLVSLLGTNKTYIYQAISRNSSENIRGIINRYRVNEAKRVIAERLARSEPLEVSSLYSLAGFNSSVSFFRAFKYYTGLTPREYASEAIKEIRNSGLKDELANDF
ncbi:MAG: helix-turn-helix domain-containing protein [Bacteroidales bacterium]|nr:helix-turn-helix domain-containing protein [Bacteroidales bacterium]